MLGSLRKSRKVAIDFGLWIAQVDRIEVELHEIEQRQAGHDEKQRASDDDDAMPFQELVYRRQECIADRFIFARRIQQLEHGRQSRDAGDECDQHAGAGDLAEFGNAFVVCRQEAQESGGGGHRRERKRNRRTARRALQRQRQIVILETLGTVADAELDAEIDAEADEQHGKGNRQQVQRSHHHQADRGRQRKADEQVDEHREDDLPGMQRHPENHKDDDDGRDTVDDRAVLHGRIFLVGDRNRTGQPHPRAVLARKIEIGRGLPDRVGRILARFQRVVVELRLEFDEGAAVGIGQRLVADEFAPGERRRLLVQDVLDRLADQVEGPFGIIELDLPALDAGEPGLQRAGQAADRGIAGHDLDQGGGGFELAGDLADFFHGQEQQPVLFEEFAGTQWLHRFEMRGVAGKFFSQRLARSTGKFGRGRLDDGENQLFAVERLLELIVADAPVEVGRNQLVDVGVDGEMLRGIVARSDRQKQGGNDDESGKPRTGSDNGDNNTGQHFVSF